MAETQIIPEVNEVALQDHEIKNADLTKLLNKLISGTKEDHLRTRLSGLKEYVDGSYDALIAYVKAYSELQARYEALEEENDELKEGLETQVQNESGSENSLDRLRTERRRLRNRYQLVQVQIKSLTDVLSDTKKELGDLRRITTRDVDSLKKVLKDQFKYKDKDFEAYKTRGELFQYLVSRIELEVATLRLQYEKEKQE
ncbi:hypothetical protein HY837_06150 [archaeon]|nr:hypothetical protein [archaeon]